MTCEIRYCRFCRCDRRHDVRRRHSRREVAFWGVCTLGLIPLIDGRLYERVARCQRCRTETRLRS